MLEGDARGVSRQRPVRGGKRDGTCTGDRVVDGDRARRRRVRRVVGASSAVLLLAGIAALGGGATAGADQGPGQGNSYAQSLQVTPHEGSLAVGAVFGEALAGHTNTFARAQSQGLDLGSVGDSMQSYNCGQAPNQNVYDAVPTPFQTETGAQGADQGQTQSPSKANYFSTEYVRADGTPYGEADTSYAGPIADPTGAFTVSGLHSKSWSGVVNGVNEAGATSDIKSVDLGAGTVVLNGLHWEVTAPTGGTPTGSFFIGQTVIGGTPVQNPLDLSTVLGAVNTALGTLGIQVQFPRSSLTQGIESVSPLEIDVVPNDNRDQLLQAAVGAAQAPYYQVTNGLENGFAAEPPPLNALGPAEATPPGQQIEQGLCQSDTPITVLDITIASFDGGGFFNAAFGGVNASSSVLPPNSYNLQALGFGTLTTPGSSELNGATLGSLGTEASPGSSVGAPGSSGGSGSGQNSGGTTGALGPFRTVAASGPLLATGLAGLALLAFLVEADRRKMRIAQRTITFEE